MVRNYKRKNDVVDKAKLRKAKKKESNKQNVFPESEMNIDTKIFFHPYLM